MFINSYVKSSLTTSVTTLFPTALCYKLAILGNYLLVFIFLSSQTLRKKRYFQQNCITIIMNYVIHVYVSYGIAPIELPPVIL